MSRISYVYIMRIVCVNLLIMVLALCIFVLDVRDDLGDRLGHAYTMLLTAVAYSLVIADSLPTLGYLTWLDVSRGREPSSDVAARRRLFSIYPTA